MAGADRFATAVAAPWPLEVVLAAVLAAAVAAASGSSGRAEIVVTDLAAAAAIAAFDRDAADFATSVVTKFAAADVASGGPFATVLVG